MGGWAPANRAEPEFVDGGAEREKLPLPDPGFPSHSITSRTTLYAPRLHQRIEGWDAGESDAMHATRLTHQLLDRYRYRHVWT